MSGNFKPLYHECNNVGRRVKSSKKRYSWKFSLENQEHSVDLYVSKLSGKRKVMCNGEIKFNGKKQGGILFSYAFKIGRTTIMVFQKEEGYDLRVDHLYFSDKASKAGSSWGAADAGGSQQDPWGARKDSWGEPKESFGGRKDSWGARRSSNDWEEAPKEKELYPRSSPFGNKSKSSNGRFGNEEDWETNAQPYQPRNEVAIGRRNPPSRMPQEEEKKPRKPEPKVQINQPPVPKPSPPKAAPQQDNLFDLLDLNAKPEPTPAALTSMQMPTSSPQQAPPPSTQLASHWDTPSMPQSSAQWGNPAPQQPFATQPAQDAVWQEAFQSGNAPEPQYMQQVIDSDDSSSDEEYADYGEYNTQPEEQYPSSNPQQHWGEEFNPNPTVAASNNPFGAAEPQAPAPVAGAFDPFSEPTQPATVTAQVPPAARPLKDDNMVSGLVDLDNLHLGDGYSPMVAAQIAESNKPVSIKQPQGPNVPMNQYATAQPTMPNNPMMMNQMMTNPMMTNNPAMMGNAQNPAMAQQAAMQQAMMNQFMTNMQMMNQFMNQPK